MIEVTEVVKRYGANTVLNRATFRIKKAQLTSILGPSGCGKSTMLRCMNRLERFDHGRLQIADVEVLGASDKALSPAEEKALTRKLRERVGIVFQNFNLFPHLTVLQNAIVAPMTVKSQERNSGGGTGASLSGQSRSRGEGRLLSRAAFGRPATARRDRARAHDGAGGDPVR